MSEQEKCIKCAAPMRVAYPVDDPIVNIVHVTDSHECVLGQLAAANAELAEREAEVERLTVENNSYSY